MMRGIEAEQVLLRLIVSESHHVDGKALFTRLIETSVRRAWRAPPP
jgi:hypothetical protein